MNACDIVYGNYLAHFGILGMKWGVRRYQNKDGSLTPAGRKRYAEISGETTRTQEPTRRAYKDESGDYVLRKGTVFNRVASKNDSADDYRKYVSFTDHDKQIFEQLGLSGKLDSGEQGKEELYAHRYEAIKDIRIANEESVRKFMAEHFAFDTKDASTNIANLGQNARDYYNLAETSINKKGALEIGRKLERSFTNGNNYVRAIMTNPKLYKQIEQEFVNRGYDAIADPLATVYSDLPIVLFSGKQTVRKTSSSKL